MTRYEVWGKEEGSVTSACLGSFVDRESAEMMVKVLRDGGAIELEIREA